MASYLVFVDTSGIQKYIFGSNRLRENIGASYLVAAATDKWANEAARKNAGEVVYAGGGNFVSLFQSQENAKAFTHQLSRKVLREAPGLQLRVKHIFVNDGDAIAAAVRDAIHELDRVGAGELRSSQMMGLSITAVCRSTGLPAVGYINPKGENTDEGRYPASAIVLAKAKPDVLKEANTELEEQLELNLTNYTYPYDLDELGRTEDEASYIAVVHADGNGVGTIIGKISDRYQNNSALNVEYKEVMHDLSEGLKAATQNAFMTVQRQLIEWINRGIATNKSGERLLKEIRGKYRGNRHILPLRPVIIGGDDVTFVCDGSIGITLAVGFVREFEKETQSLSEWLTSLLGESISLSACAGVAIVKTHYPFARAYSLSEELCKSAKSYRKQLEDIRKAKNPPDTTVGGCIDWHFATTGLSGNLKTIREREYGVRTGNLNLRPITIETNTEHPLRSWDTVSELREAFEDPDWAEKRSKIKALRDALREGPDSVKRFSMIYGQILPAMVSAPNIHQNGWEKYEVEPKKVQSFCAYFDAIELLDWYAEI